jgi:hypothetical protein
LSDEIRRNLDSFEDALALAAELHGNIIDASEEMGNGFAILAGDDKSRLKGVHFIIIGWQFSESSFSDNALVSAALVTGG